MNTRIAAAGLAVLAVAVGGFAYYEQTHSSSPTKTQTSSLPAVAPVVPPDSPTQAPAAEPREAFIYTVSSTGGDSNNLAPVKVAVDNPSAPAKPMLEALIRSPQSPLPRGTRLLAVRIVDGLATVDFSKDIQRNFQGGDLQEAQAVNSILMTLGQFPSIDRVQLLVEGAPIDSLGGHFEINSPIPVIRPSSVQEAKNGG